MSDGSMQAASQAQPITRELGIGEIISRTFAIYRRNLVRFVIIYVIVEAIVAVVTLLVARSIIVATPVVSSTGTVPASELSGPLGNVFIVFGVLLLLAIILGPIEIGTAIKMSSDEIEKGEANLVESVKFMVRRLLWFWVALIIVGILVSIGFFLLFVPGIILAIMFSLVPPVIVIEKAGALASLGRSRALVAHRWLKTFALGIVLIVIAIVPTIILELVGRLAGAVGAVVGDLLSILVLPIIPIALTVYYYSNVARTTPPQQTGPTFTGWTPASGVRYCPSCGTQLPATATFCPSCGAKLDI